MTQRNKIKTNRPTSALNGKKNFFANAPLAPRAICLAFLKLP